MRLVIGTAAILFSFASSALDVRFGGAIGAPQKLGASNGSTQSFAFTPSNLSADMVFYFDRIGIGARYTKTDTIGDYKVAAPANQTLGYKSVDPSTLKMLNSSFSLLASYRFFENEFRGDFQYDKIKIGNVNYKSFADLALTVGKSDKFQMITTNDVGQETVFGGSDILNYSASIITGMQMTVIQIAFEFGYKEILINDAKSEGTNANLEASYKIVYPFLGASLGFGF